MSTYGQAGAANPPINPAFQPQPIVFHYLNMFSKSLVKPLPLAPTIPFLECPNMDLQVKQIPC